MDVMRALDAAGVDAVDLNRREATLDDVFLTLTDSTATTRRGLRMTAMTEPGIPTGAPPPPRRTRPSSTTSAEPAQLAANWWSDTLVFAGRNIEHIRQIPEKLLDVTIQPLMFVLLFAYVFGGAIAVKGGNYREYLIGGILIQSLAFGLTGPATAISTDLTEGVIDRFRSLPATRAAYLSGHYVAEMAGMALSIVVLLSAGLLVGWRTHTDILHVTGRCSCCSCSARR